MWEVNLMKCLAVVQLYADCWVRGPRTQLNSTQIQKTIKFRIKTISFLVKAIKSNKKLLKIDKQPISALSVAGKWLIKYMGNNWQPEKCNLIHK